MSVWALVAKILFVGHSLVGPTLPSLVEAGLTRMDAPAEVVAQVINGAPLAYGWDHSSEAQGVDARVELLSGGVDALILTEALPLAGHVEWNDPAAQVGKFARLARDHNPDVRVYLYETWHGLSSGNGATQEDPGAAVPWRDRLRDDLPVWEKIADDATALHGAGPVTLIPAGQAMGLLADEIAAGQVPGLQSMGDLFSDDIHPNGKGLYFVAMVHLSALTGRSPEGLPAKLTRIWPTRDSVISDETALALQKIAHRAVTDHAAGQAARRAAAMTETPVAADEPAAPVAAAEAPVAEAAPVPEAAPPAPFPDFAPITNPNLTLNLSGVDDWAVQQPFLDIMKTARTWTGHLPDQWGGWDHDRLAAAGALDADGWPIRLPPELTGIATLVLTDLPTDAAGMTGRYLLTWQGKAKLTLDGRARIAETAADRIAFDYEPGPGSVIVTLTEIDPADPPRDMVIVREDRAGILAQGAIFNPDWLARIRGVRGLRFMDWMKTNSTTLADPAARPRPADYTWTRAGIPVEVMVALANELDADPWFTLPHLANDALVREMAQIVSTGLEPGRKAWVEYSNEVWNWGFPQASWAEEQGRARWGKDTAWVQFYALRATEVAAIWTDVFGATAPDRLVRVIGTQTGWKGLEDLILDAPLVMAEGKPAPATGFDVYAVTGYVSGGLVSEERVPLVHRWLEDSQTAAEDGARTLGMTGQAARDHVATHRFDLAVTLAAQEMRDGSTSGQPTDTLRMLLDDTLRWQAAVAQRHGLRLVMYEGGLHTVGLGPVVDDDAITAFLNHLAFTPEMGAIYTDLLAGWAELSDAPFTAYTDVATPTKWGSWGALRHLGDDNPRWQALAGGCAGC